MAPRMIMLTDDILRDLVLIITDALTYTHDPKWEREDAEAIRDFISDRAAEAEPAKPEPKLEWVMAGKHPDQGWKAEGVDGGEYLIQCFVDTRNYGLTYTPSGGLQTYPIRRDDLGKGHSNVHLACEKAEEHNAEHNAAEIPPPHRPLRGCETLAAAESLAERRTAPESDAEPSPGTEIPSEDPEAADGDRSPGDRVEAAASSVALVLWSLFRETCTAAGMPPDSESSKLPEVVGNLLKSEEALRGIVQSVVTRGWLAVNSPTALRNADDALGLPNAFVGSNSELEKQELKLYCDGAEELVVPIRPGTIDNEILLAFVRKVRASEADGSETLWSVKLWGIDKCGLRSEIKLTNVPE